MQTVSTGEMKFKKRLVGINPLPIEIGETRQFQITSEILTHTKKDGDQIEYVNATDLETGEEGLIWLDGNLRHQFSVLFQSSQPPLFVELQKLEKTEADVVIDGKKQTTMVNQWKMFELQPMEETEG